MSQIKVELQEVMGDDRSIAEAAWTSSSTYQQKNKKTKEDVKRVVEMLAKDRHATPFESVVMRFWIKLPIAIDRQHMTHRIGSHNGMSGRYRTMPREFLALPQDVLDIYSKVHPDEANIFKKKYNEICKLANDFYENECKAMKAAFEDKDRSLITSTEYKRVREFVRGVLPQHNMTERVTIFNLRSFANYQKLRNESHAQLEIQEVAKLMLDEVKAQNVAPVAIEWLEKNNWNI
jgi:thymidylate synthase (FAD)